MKKNNKYVFIIDDFFVTANRLFNSLSQNAKILIVGFSRNGKGALLEMAKNPPDMVILDLLLPDMDGLDLVRKIKERYVTTTIIVLSDTLTNDSRKECKKLGVEAIFDKTIEFDQAIEKVNLLINGNSN